MRSLTLAALAALPAAQAVTIPIDVGSSGLTITPKSLTANVGDVLEFHFYPRTHSVAQGDWTHPCGPIPEGGFYSGFIPVASGESNITFSVVVNNTDPMLIYCSVGPHCKLGMYNVVNPAGNQTFESYAPLAANSSDGISPDTVFGGRFGTLNTTEWASSSSSASSSTSTSSSASVSSSSLSVSTTATPTSLKTSTRRCYTTPRPATTQ